MNFRNVPVLWLLAVIPLIAALLASRETYRTRIARRFASERLRGVSIPARVLRPWSLTLAAAAAVIALAGPHAGVMLVPIVAAEANRILIIDISHSMAAEDVGPARLTAAKALAVRLAERQQGRVALVAFEAQPEVLSPLTTDTVAVASLIDSLVPGELGDAGSDIGSALIGAMTIVESDRVQNADLVLISDGEDQGARLADAIQRAKALGIKISTILVGTADGSSIPTARGPLRDTSGEVVTTYARPDVMARIAAETGGRSLENPFDAAALDPLSQRGANGPPRETHARIPIERFQWPLTLSFIALFASSLLNRGGE